MKKFRDYFGKINETEMTLHQIRNRLVNQSLFYILIIGLPGILSSLFRAAASGWQLVMSLQIVLYFVALAMVVFRKRITFFVRTAVLLGANLLLGIVGLGSFGLAGVAILTLAMFCLLTAILLGNRSAVIALIISLVVVVIAGIGSVTGNTFYTFDANVYIVSPAAWLFAMIGLTIIAGLSIIGVGTTQAHLQNALQQSQAQYKTLFDKANDTILISDMHGNLLNVNQRVCTQLGYSCAELRGMTIEDILASEYVGDYHERMSKIIALGHIVFDTAYLHRNGRIIPVELSATLIEYGSETAVLGIARDITDRLQAQALLEAGKTRLQTIFQAVPIGVSMVQDRIVTFANNEIERILGYTNEELIGQDVTILFPDEVEFARIKREKYSILAETGAASIETQFRRKDGEVIDVSMRAALIDPPHISAGIIFTAINITEQKRIEIALRESEARYRNIFETTAVSIWEEDFTELRAAIEAIKAEGVTDFKTYLDGHPDFINRAIELINIMDVNEATLKMYEASGKEELLGSLNRIFIPEMFDAFKQELIAIAEERPFFMAESVVQTLSGKRLNVLLRMAIPTQNEEFARVLISLMDITERKQAEEALKETHQLLETIFNHTHIMVAYLDAQFNFLRVNRAYALIDEREPSFFPGKNHFDLYPNVENEALFRRVVETGIPHSEFAKPFEYIEHPDRGESYWDWNLVPIKDSDNTVVALIFSLLNVTERVKVEGKLRTHARQQAAVAQLGQRALAGLPLCTLFDEAAQLATHTLRVEFCKVLELLPDGNAMLLRAGVGWQAGLINKAIVETGLDSQAGFTLLSDEPVIVTNLAADARFNAPLLLRNHGVVSGMSTIIRGGKRPYGILGVHTAHHRIFSEDDVNFLQAIANVLAEVVALRQAETARLESEERYRLLVEMSPDGIVLHRNGKLIYANAAAAFILGADSPDELLDKPIEAIVHPDYWEKTMKRGERMVAGDQGLYPAEDMYVRLDGAPVSVEVTVAALMYQGETAVQAIFRDISHRKQIENELQLYREGLEALVVERTAELQQRVAEVEQLNNGMLNLLTDLQLANDHVSRTARQLEETNAELEAFAYSVSHDLRAPLRHINGFVTMLQKRESDRLDEKSAHYLQVIAKAAEKMGQLIDDLLAFSRTGRQDLFTRPVDVNKLITEVRRELAPDIEDRDVVWEIAALPMVTADPALLRQVWANLLENAVKYTALRPQARIEIGAFSSEENNEIVFFTRDNGVGFDERYVDKLFGVFQRLHREDEYEGTGIGLATVRRIIHKHNGRTWAEGEVGKGATFYFTLPENSG